MRRQLPDNCQLLFVNCQLLKEISYMIMIIQLTIDK